jgi:Protein of unknown function (DUF1018)
MSPMTEAERAAKIKLVHVAKSKLKLSDAAYRLILSTKFGVMSSKGLNDAELEALMQELRKMGFVDNRFQRRSTTKRKMNQAEYLALLLEQGGHSASYADAIALRMYKVNRYVWCSAQQKAAIVGVIKRENERRDAKGAA